MNSKLKKILMSDKTLDEFIEDCGKAIITIGQQKNRHIHTELYPNWSNPTFFQKEESSQENVENKESVKESNLAKILMGDKNLDEFIDERGKAITEIGQRKSKLFKSIRRSNGSETMKMYPEED